VSFNVEDRSKGKSIDQEETKNELKKGPKRDQSSLSVMNHSQFLFKMEVKANIKPYQGEIDNMKLNHWL